jgi:aminopeptidase N
MNKLFLFLTLLSNYNCIAQANNPLKTFDVEKYSFNISVNENTDSILCEAYIEYKIIAKTSTLLFNFKSQNKFKKGMTIGQVWDEKSNKLLFQHKNDLLQITLKNTDKKSGYIKIAYKGIPENGLVIGKNKFGDKTWFGDNWPNRAQYWLPCVDHPADKALFNWMVTAPIGYIVVGNGYAPNWDRPENNDGTNYWEFNQTEPISTKVAVIGIAKLEKKCLQYNDSLNVCNYYYPQTFKQQPNKMDVAIEILAFFEKTIGPYPYKKLNNVQSTTMFGGMENANNIFYDEYAVDDTATMEPLIAHEIAHQWFGNTVTEKDFSHIWLSEGFATFFTNYYLEYKYGEEVMKLRLNEDRVKVMAFLRENPRKVVDTTKNYMNLLNANSYQKGGLFLQALRIKVGDTIFLQIVRTYFNTYKFANATTNDFKKIVETITKKDFTSFFNQWLYSTTLPKF